MGDWAEISVSDFKRINRAVRAIEQMIGDAPPHGRHPQPFQAGRWARITGCTLSTGYATIQFCNGDPGGTLTPDTSITVKCFIGINSWWRSGDDVFVVPGMSPNLSWVAVAGKYGPKFWANPGTDGSTLASPQDNPAAESYCTQSVTVP